MIIRATMAVILVAAPALAGQDALTPRVMTALRAAIAPAVPFPPTDDTGGMPANGSTEALWMVRWPEPGEQAVEVIANPLNEINQLRARRAMSQIQDNIEAAQRRAEAQYDRAVAEAKRTGRSQDVDGVTLSDEGIAGAKIDAESHALIEVAFNRSAYRSEFTSGIGPDPSVETGAERFCEAETLVYLGRVSRPVMKKRGDSSVFEVTAAATPSGNAAIESLVVRFRGNEALIGELVRKTRWSELLELLKEAPRNN
jgi:hypothetical protein